MTCLTDELAFHSFPDCQNKTFHMFPLIKSIIYANSFKYALWCLFKVLFRQSMWLGTEYKTWIKPDCFCSAQSARSEVQCTNTLCIPKNSLWFHSSISLILVFQSVLCLKLNVIWVNSALLAHWEKKPAPLSSKPTSRPITIYGLFENTIKSK